MGSLAKQGLSGEFCSKKILKYMNSGKD